MRFIKASAVAATGIVLALGVNSCGWNHDNADAAKALTSSMQQPNTGLTADQAKCLGNGYVDALGAKKLVHYGILTSDLKIPDNTSIGGLTQSDARAFAGASTRCLDVDQLFLGGTIPPKLKTPEVKACLDKAFPKDRETAIIIAGLTNDPKSAQQKVTDAKKALTDCPAIQQLIQQAQASAAASQSAAPSAAPSQ